MGSYKNLKAKGGYSADGLVLVYWEMETTTSGCVFFFKWFSDAVDNLVYYPCGYLTTLEVEACSIAGNLETAASVSGSPGQELSVTV